MSSFVTISEAASLALHASTYIAHNPDKKISVQEIAGAMGCNVHHLAKVMQRLTKCKILRSSRGPGGGFMLAKAPHDISLYDIYVCIDGEIDEPECPLERKRCPFSVCILDDVVQETNAHLKNYLQSRNLGQYSK